MLIQNREMVWIGAACLIVAMLLIFAGPLFDSVILLTLSEGIGMVLIIWVLAVASDLRHCYKAMTEREKSDFWMCWYDTNNGGIWMNQGKRIGG